MITLEDIRKAQQRIAKTEIRLTDLRLSPFFSKKTRANVYLKMENTQRTGAYKIRGATNCIFAKTAEELPHGVVTASAGNHGKGVALASSWLNVPSTIVMPKDTPITKVGGVERYETTTVVLEGFSYEEARAKADELGRTTGQRYISAFNDWLVIAGQGTIGIEMFEQAKSLGVKLDTVIVPVGGAGLIAGVAVALKSLDPDIEIIGVQAEGADAVVRSFKERRRVNIEHPKTIAEGIKVSEPGELPMEVVLSSQDFVDAMVTVSEEEISLATYHIFSKIHQKVEAAGAVGIAALLSKKVVREGKNVGVILSGGNIDDFTFLEILNYALRREGIHTSITIRLPEGIGNLTPIYKFFQDQLVFVRDMHRHRHAEGLAFREADFEFHVVTKDQDHLNMLAFLLTDKGFNVISTSQT